MDKYVLLRRIGSGSYGIAYLGREKSSGDYYVFKEIDAKALPPEEVKKVAFEIKVLSTMRHDFIVRYHDYCKHNGNIYIIMGYCPGGDMHERIKKQGSTPFPSEQVFKWFLQTALVLHYLHTKKVIHRDIKPQNLFLDDKGDIKVGDFGISRVLQFTQDLAQTAVGTPLYVAPEVVKGVGYDAKADVWSMGCTFYEILTLNPPFSGMSISDLMMKVRTANYQRISSRFDPELKELIESMIVVDPKQRPSIEDILMKPCCMERLHRLYPQYIPTLFPYSAPVLNPSQPSIHSSRVSVASSQQSSSSHRSYYTRLSAISSPSRMPMATPVATPVVMPVVTPVVTPVITPVITPVATPVTSNPSSGKQPKPHSSSHSSHSIVPQRIVSMTGSSSRHSIFSSDAEAEILPRRFSFPVQSIDPGTRPTSPTKGTLQVMETVEEKPGSVASVTPNEVVEKPKHPKYSITPTRIESDASASLLLNTPAAPSPTKAAVPLQEKRKESVKPLKEELISSVPIPKPLPIPPTAKRAPNHPPSVEKGKEGEKQKEREATEARREVAVMEAKKEAVKQPKSRRRKDMGLFDPWHTPTTHEIIEHNNALRRLRRKENL